MLIWICVIYESTSDPHYIRDGLNKKRSPQVLDGWSQADTVAVKHTQMFDRFSFQEILSEFSDDFRELESMMREIGQVLFPV